MYRSTLTDISWVQHATLRRTVSLWWNSCMLKYNFQFSILNLDGLPTGKKQPQPTQEYVSYLTVWCKEKVVILIHSKLSEIILCWFSLYWDKGLPSKSMSVCFSGWNKGADSRFRFPSVAISPFLPAFNVFTKLPTGYSVYLFQINIF